MEATLTPRKAQRGSKVLSGLLLTVAVLGVCAFQYGDKYGLNSLPFAEVRPLVSDLAKAQGIGERKATLIFLREELCAGRR